MNESILKSLKPWMVKPFEFIFHAETHYRSGSDYDKRMAFINFDTAIEVSIYTFMNSNTKPKGTKIYKTEDLERVKNSYFSKLEEFEKYIKTKNIPIVWDKNNINYYHEQRNNLYHDSSLFSPDSTELNEIRQISLWVFSVLFDILKIGDILDVSITDSELECPKIPEEYAKPVISGIEQQHENSFFIALILGGWNENVKGDSDIINEMSDNPKKWINDIREINKYNGEVFSLRSGHWLVKEKAANLSKYALFFYDSHLELIKNISLKVLSEIHPKFDLQPKDRYASAIYGKVSKFSSTLRKGIVETLVFLGIHGKELENCTLHKSDGVVCLTIRELFKNPDWKLWASLGDVLPLLAEADPDEFLSSVENALKQSPCPFDELFSQENGDIMGVNYMTGLFWALETLAWSEDHLSKTILLLAELATHDPGGKWTNRPDKSIITILLPWIPQTMASLDKKEASLKGIQRNFPDIAWKVLTNLLPKFHQVSMGSYKPTYRNYIPPDWKKGVSKAEYWEQVQKYAGMTVEMAKLEIRYASELVDILENIPQPSYNTFLEYLSSDKIVKLPDEQKTTIWEKLISFVNKHRCYSDAKWALPAEMIDVLEQTAEKLMPSNPYFLYRHLFSGKNFYLDDRNEDWQTCHKKLLDQRTGALKQIYGINKTESVMSFAKNVGDPALVGDVFARIASENDNSEILPSFLDCQEKYIKQFISGFIWTRYRNEGVKWLEDMCMTDWSNEQKYALFLYLPFETEIWEKAEEILDKHVDEYWKKINSSPYPAAQGNLLSAIENLLKYGRPRFALSCIHAHYHLQKEFYREQAIKALIEGISSDEPIEELDSYNTVEMIGLLQNDPSTNEDDLFKIEWGYLPLLDRYNGAEPKLLEKYLSQKPEFFIEVIQLLYLSEKNDKPEEEPNEQMRNLIDNAWKLLDDWRHPPGKMDDGSFSSDLLKKWVGEVKTKTIESGHYKVAMNHLGHVLFYADADQNGLWIQQSVAEILDGNDDIRQAFISEAYNSRGAHFVDPSGKSEKTLADLWRKKGEDIEKLGLVHFASSLKDLSKSYEREAERVKSRYSAGSKDEGNNGADNVI